MFDREFGEFFGEPLAGAEPSVGPGDALCAVFVGGEGTEFLELSDGAFGIEGHGMLAGCWGLDNRNQISDIRRQEKRKTREEKRVCGTRSQEPTLRSRGWGTLKFIRATS
jgi:hypothetical protein